jgi:transposase, IS30 family
MKSYKQLTRDQRYVIKTLLQEDYSYREIAKRVGVNVSTISREIKRNKTGDVYLAGFADQKAVKRKRIGRRPTVLTESNIAIFKPYLEDDWSPEQVSGRLKLTGELSISYETIYKYIYQDKKKNGVLHERLRGKHKYRKKYGTQRRYKITGKKSISKRSTEADERARFGDWEIDTVVSRKSKDVLVTIVDRKLRYTLIGKATNKSSDKVTKATLKCFKGFEAPIHSITADNGTEFAGFKRIEKGLGTEVFFAHPYSSYERGTNENTNGLIRQYYPKGVSFEKATWKDLKVVQDKINNRPRKCLGYKTAAEVYLEEMSVALEK